MTNSRRDRGRWSIALLVALSTGAATRASEPTSEPWLAIQRSLSAVERSVSNVEKVIKQEARVMIPVAGASTWLEQCCRYNVEKVAAAAAELKSRMDYLEAQYARDSNIDALRKLTEMRQHLAEVVTIFGDLRGTTTQREAEARLRALLHPFNHARQIVTDLAACCPVAAPAP